MQSVRVTLYEVFGYVAPGTLALIAVAIATWGFYYPSSNLTVIAPHYNVIVLGSLLLLAYLAGHIIQALGNLCFVSAEVRPKLVAECKAIADSAAETLRNTYRNIETVPKFKDIVSLSGAVLSQTGNGDEYELYIYREGFYRGASIGIFFCGVSLMIRLLHPTLVSISGKQLTIPLSLLCLTGLSCFGAAWLFYSRFKRFGEYRVRHILNVVTIFQNRPKSDQSEKED
jgi:hypothetical protein